MSEQSTSCMSEPVAKEYVGLKTVKAWPQLGTHPPKNGGFLCDQPSEYGYGVQYEDGYISWSPKDVFEAAYKASGNMDFSMALFMLKRGHKVARLGWNGRGQWCVLMPGLKLPPFSSQEPGAKVNDRTAKHIGSDTPLDSQPYFALWNAQGKWQPGWVPSTGDLLADDWAVVEYDR
jgi:hypothetical protein